MSVIHSHALKYSQGELGRNQAMDSNIGVDSQQHCHQHNSGTGLLRYRSAPSSMLTSLVEDNNNNYIHGCLNNGAFISEDHNKHYVPSSTSSEMETMLEKLISLKKEDRDIVSSQGLPQPQQHHSNNNESNRYSFVSQSQSQLIYQLQQIQGLQNNGSLGAFDCSLSSENNTKTKMGSSNNCSNLVRQKSSPAGFFSNYSVDNGLAAFRGSDVSNGQATTSSTSGLHCTLNFSSSRPSSCSRRMPQIAESGNEGFEANCVENRNLGNDSNGSTKCYMPSLTTDFWDGSAFNASKTASNNNEIMFSTSNALEAQDDDLGYQRLGLSHHLSLPSSSKMEKLFQIQGSVPCKIRAKRGFATHPRSIAERERRTRISARIKKLQDLFPKSDKQTSTADMLDFAVDYIKDLQKQVKILKDTRAKCTCSSNKKQ